MKTSLSDAEILFDLELIDDTGKSNHYAVKWRRVGVGFIQTVRRPRKKLPAEVKAIYDQNADKWFNPWRNQGYHDTKEGAAIALVQGYLEKNCDHEITRAMIRKDYEFIDQWLKMLVEKLQVEVVDGEKPTKGKRKED